MRNAVATALAALRRAEARAASLPRAHRLNAALYALALLGAGLLMLEVRQSEPEARDVRAFADPTVATTRPAPPSTTTTAAPVAALEEAPVGETSEPPAAVEVTPLPVPQLSPPIASSTPTPPPPTSIVVPEVVVAEPQVRLPEFSTAEPPSLQLPSGGAVGVPPMAPIVVDPVEPVTPNIPPVQMPAFPR